MQYSATVLVPLFCMFKIDGDDENEVKKKISAIFNDCLNFRLKPQQVFDLNELEARFGRISDIENKLIGWKAQIVLLDKKEVNHPKQ
jgi:hypothetical protein